MQEAVSPDGVRLAHSRSFARARVYMRELLKAACAHRVTRYGRIAYTKNPISTGNASDLRSACRTVRSGVSPYLFDGGAGQILRLVPFNPLRLTNF
jgi:hypothetical protein